MFAAAADSTWTQVSWTGDSVWDNCGIDTSYFSLANGDYLPLGFFKIDFFAYDFSGNGDTCSFFIDIQDTTAPAFVGALNDMTLYTTQDSCSVLCLDPTNHRGEFDELYDHYECECG